MKKKNEEAVEVEENENVQVNEVEVEENENVQVNETHVLIPTADVVIGSWVLVQYEGESYLGIGLEWNLELNCCRVQCLAMPYGVNFSQELEKAVDAVWYYQVYPAPVVPRKTEFDQDGNRSRKDLYTY